MKLILCFAITLFSNYLFGQNIGIGTSNPIAKLHIKGSGNVSQLIIDAGNTQNNSNPLIKLRSSNGKDLLWIHSDDSSNTFIGYHTGRSNVASATGGIYNTFNGCEAGLNNGTGKYNAALGYAAFRNNLTGNYNLAAGFCSLYSNTSGNFNSSIGTYNLYTNTTGAYNAALGYTALFNNTSGNYNTAVGTSALYTNNTGDHNAAIGHEALYNNTYGSYNAAVGNTSLRANTIGHDNIAVGAAALYSNINGSYNTATGSHALFFNAGSDYNTAIGYASLYFNAGGSFNTACGFNALASNTSGGSNTANGTEALRGNTTGYGNTAIGYQALFSNTTSELNTILGYRAGYDYNMGSNNTLIGADSKVSSDGISNSIALGNAAIVFASNNVRVGNSSITSIGGYAGWTNFSDGRFKKNIQENVRGLDFIMKLRPVTYQLDISGLSKKLNENKGKTVNAAMQTAAIEKEKIIQSGFIAQEVERAAKELGYDFSGVDKPKNENDFYGLRYSEFVVPLVKAVQEQQQLIASLQKEIEALKKNIIPLVKSSQSVTIK